MVKKTDFPTVPRLLFEGSADNPFLVVFKPSGMPSAPLRAGEGGNALEYAAELFPKVLSILGNKQVEGGLLHRLDTDTEGLLLVALTQECMDTLRTVQREGRFIKYYRALCKKQAAFPEGFPECPVDITAAKDFPVSIFSRFRPYGPGRQQVRPVGVSAAIPQSFSAQKKAGKEVYETIVRSCATVSDFDGVEDIFQLEYALTKGFRHQLRCHSAWLGLPIIGDRLYNRVPSVTDLSQTHSGIQPAEQLRLLAWKIEFPHPITGRPYTFSL